MLLLHANNNNGLSSRSQFLSASYDDESARDNFKEEEAHCCMMTEDPLESFWLTASASLELLYNSVGK